jgi:hypothetical protein
MEMDPSRHGDRMETTAAVGGAAGAVLGLLAGSTLLAVPGLGPIVVAGAMASGITGGIVRRLVLHRSPLLDVASRPGEEERGFRIRLAPLLRAERDRRLGEIQETFGKKIERVDERIRRAQVRREKEEDQAGARKRDFWISAATALGSALLGRKLGGASLGRATTTARGYSRVRKEAQDVELAEAEVARLRQEREELAAELERALEDLRDDLDAASDDLDTIEIDPRRTDVKVDWVGLAWVPD